MAKRRIIFGTMTLGPEGTSGARVTDIESAKQIVDSFKQHGYNELDTARVYCNGETEGYLAQIGYKEAGFKLATKVYPTETGMHKPEILRAKLEESLEKLKQPSVDIFYLHAPDWKTPLEPTLQTVNELYKEGKFKTFALSNYCAWQVAEIVILCRERGWVRPTLYQAMYNAITRAIEPELIPACRRYGLDIVIYNPIAGGFFAGAYKKDVVPESGRFSSGAQGENYRKRYFRDVYFDALEVLEPVAKKNNLTMIELGLRWMVHHSALKITDGNDGIIIGASSLHHLESNLKDLEKGPLPEECVKALDEAWRIVKPECPNYWHGEVAITYQV